MYKSARGAETGLPNPAAGGSSHFANRALRHGLPTTGLHLTEDESDARLAGAKARNASHQMGSGGPTTKLSVGATGATNMGKPTCDRCQVNRLVRRRGRHTLARPTRTPPAWRPGE